MADLSVAVDILGKDLLSGPASLGQKALSGLESTVHSGASALGGFASALTAPVRGLGGLVDGLGKVGLAGLGLKTLAEGVGGVLGGMVSGNAQMETYTTQLGTLLGSADKAKDRLAELADFGAKTPFELPEIVKAEKVLLGFGLTGQKAVQLTGKSASDLRTVMGDIAAGTGASFEEVALTFGKFSAGATGEAISRLQEMGVVTREQLTGMGVQFSKSGELVSPLPQAMAAAVTIAGDKFGGGMAALSNTFEGQMSNLADGFNQAKNVVTQPLFDALKPALVAVNALIGSAGFQGALKSAAEWLGGSIQSGLSAVAGLFDRLKGPIGTAVNWFLTFKGALSGDWLGNTSADIDNVTKWFGQLGLTIADIKAAFSGGLGDVEGWTSALRDNVGIDLTPFTGAIQGAFDLVQGLLANVGPVIQGVVGNIGTNLSALGGLVKQALSGDIGGAIVGFIGLFVDGRVKLAETVAGWVGVLVGWIAPLIPGLGTQLASFVQTIFTGIGSIAVGLVERLAPIAAALITWIAPLIPPLLRELGAFTVSMIQWAGDALPVIAAKLLEWAGAFIQWIAPLIPPVVAELGNLLRELSQWLLNVGLPALITRLGEWGSAFITWIQPLIPPMLAEMVTLLGQFGGWLRDVALPAIGTELLAWGQAFVTWVLPVIPPLLIEAGKLLLALADWTMKVALPEISKKLLEWAGAFLDWIRVSVLPFLGARLGEIWTAILGWVNKTLDDVKTAAASLGRSIIEGIKQGVENAKEGLFSYLRGIAEGALAAAKAALHISSPSQLFADEVGAPMIQGIMVGILAEKPMLDKTLTNALLPDARLVQGYQELGVTIGTDLADGFATVGQISEAVFKTASGDVWALTNQVQFLLNRIGQIDLGGIDLGGGGGGGGGNVNLGGIITGIGDSLGLTQAARSFSGRGETAPAASTVVNVYPSGAVIAERDLAEHIQRALDERDRLNGRG